jgi:tagatose 6-phosphate kinase
MILCITPNAAIDRTLLVPNLQPGVLIRPTRTIAVAGGKGFNVARAIRLLGGQAMCASMLGGHTGRLAADLAQQEGLSGTWTWLETETRTCTIIISAENEQVFEIYEKGITISTGDWSRFQTDVVRVAVQAKLVCLSGSLPPGCPPDAPADLIDAVQAIGRPVWVDTSRPALKAALSASPAGLKINASEAGEILGEAIDSARRAVQVAAEIRQKGVETVVLTLGERGAIVVNGAGSWWAQPPDLPTISAVGSGDSFLAGLVTGFEKGLPAADVLRRAVAAGAANALSPGGAQFKLSDFKAVMASISINRIGSF